MSTRFRTIFTAILVVGSYQASASAGLIFDNSTTGYQGITTPGQPQIGGQVTSSTGAPSIVTEIDLGFTSNSNPVTADVQAFLYANDGAGGTPGTLLWSSAVMTSVNFNTDNYLLAFVVPSITVPTSFTFTGAITNSTGGTLGFVPATGATVGTFNQVVAGSPGSWSNFPSNFEVEARILGDSVSVPEPSSIVLAGAGLPVLFGYIMARRRRIS